MSRTSDFIHPASLVCSSRHSQKLLQLVNLPLSAQFIGYFIDCITETVSSALRPPPPTTKVQNHRPEFTAFVTAFLHRSRMTTATVLVSLVYLTRVRPYLRIPAEHCAFERVFLGAVIVASKFTQDSTLKNGDWARCTGLFGRRDVGRMEREFLDVLDFDLAISEKDILAHRSGILRAITVPTQVHFKSTYRSQLAAMKRSYLVSPPPHYSKPSSPSTRQYSPSSDSDSDSTSPPTPRESSPIWPVIMKPTPTYPKPLSYRDHLSASIFPVAAPPHPFLPAAVRF